VKSFGYHSVLFYAEHSSSWGLKLEAQCIRNFTSHVHNLISLKILASVQEGGLLVPAETSRNHDSQTECNRSTAIARCTPLWMLKLLCDFAPFWYTYCTMDYMCCWQSGSAVEKLHRIVMNPNDITVHDEHK